MHWLSSWPSLSWCSSSLCPLYTGLLIVQNNVASELFWTMSSGAVAVPIRPLSEPRKYTFSDKKNQFSSSLPVWTKTIPNISRAGQMCLVMCALYIQSWFACNFCIEAIADSTCRANKGKRLWRGMRQSFPCTFFIGPRSDHSLPMSVTDWLTH